MGTTSTASQGFTLTVRERGFWRKNSGSTASCRPVTVSGRDTERYIPRHLPCREPYLPAKTDRQRVPVLEAQGIEIKHETVVFSSRVKRKVEGCFSRRCPEKEKRAESVSIVRRKPVPLFCSYQVPAFSSSSGRTTAWIFTCWE